MKNFIESGDNLTLPMPYATVPGQGVLIGGVFGVAAGTYALGEDGVINTEGVFDMVKAAGAGTAMTLGGPVYWDNTAKLVTGVASGNTLIGKALAVADTAAVLARVWLD